MKFDKKHKVFAAASREDSRYNIGSILFERDDDGARLVATNGRILAVVPVEDADGDVPGMISQDAIREAVKARTNAQPDAQVLLPDEKVAKVMMKHGGLAEHSRPDETSFPEWKAVLPKAKNPVSITLSARYLRDLADALGVAGDGITLTFDLQNGKIDGGLPVRVDASSPGNHSYGAIMPIEAK